MWYKIHLYSNYVQSIIQFDASQIWKDHEKDGSFPEISKNSAYVEFWELISGYHCSMEKIMWIYQLIWEA